MGFKWSHFRKNCLNKILKLIVSKTKINRSIGKDKVLIVTVDALGDNLVKATTIKKISEYYGKENIYILCKDKWAKIYELQGYNVFIDRYKNFIDRIKIYRKVNEIPYKKVIYFNHSGANYVEELILCRNKVENKSNYKYILEQHLNLLKDITGRDYGLNDIRPDLKKIYEDESIKDTISIGIGAANQEKTLPLEKMKEILEHLIEKFPYKEIVLLGSGKKQIDYTQKMLKNLKLSRVKNLVGKITLTETLKIVANSDVFIGYDSGLTNAAFSFNTKYICLHWDLNSAWNHKYENCCTIFGDGQNAFMDGIHGTEILNSITLDQIDEGIKDLEIE